MNREGRRLFCRVEGDGPPVIFLHGAIVDADFFSGVSAQLRDSWRVISYDRRGYSRSEGADRFGIREQANDAADLLSALTREPAVVVGCSLGATIAMRLAADYPSLVSGLILHEPPLQFLPGTKSREEADELGAIRALAGQGDCRQALLRFLMSTARQADARSQPYSPEKLDQHMRNGMLFMERELSELFYADRESCGLPRLIGRNHTCCLRGDSSGEHYAARAASVLAKQIGCPLVYVPGGHNAARDLPVEFAAAIAGLRLLDKEKKAL